MSELSFFLADFPQKSAFCQKSFHQKSPFYQNAAPSVCQKSPSFCLISFRNLLLSVRFPSKICQVSLRNFLLSVINLLLSVRFPSEISFFLSEISFPSSFPQKFSFCEVSFRNLLSVSFPLEISFFLSEVRNILLSVRFSSDISFFLSDISFLSSFPQKSPAFLELK